MLALHELCLASLHVFTECLAVCQASVACRQHGAQVTQREFWNQTVLVVKTAGEYSAERLQALQQSTPVLVSKPRQEKEPAFKLSGSFRRATAAVDDRFTTNGVRPANTD